MVLETVTDLKVAKKKLCAEELVCVNCLSSDFEYGTLFCGKIINCNVCGFGVETSPKHVNLNITHQGDYSCLELSMSLYA